MKKIQKVSDIVNSTDSSESETSVVNTNIVQDIKLADAEMMPLVVAPQRVVERAPANVKVPSRDVWEEIRSLPIEMYSLPAQRVDFYTSAMSHNDEMAILTYKAPAMISCLESLIGKKFTVEPKEKYLVITRK